VAPPLTNKHEHEHEHEDEDEHEDDNRELRTVNRERRTPTKTPRSFLDSRFLGNPAALALAVSRLETEGGFSEYL
jgi:hypothetical protein